MEFTMGRDRFFITRQEEQHGVGSGSSSTAPFGRDGGGGNWLAEKEHMFDKVVTPSDVGKLNRLVIPKQYAERYFPLDSAANEKGLLLSFEDRSGKSWRFRYSYWNSSQSYVMTKGWSRFVKEKRLDAGDTVSFSRGIGEAARGHLYIDWMRRSDAHDPARGHLYIDWMRRSDAHDPARLPRIPVQGFSFGCAPPVAPWASHHFFMPPAVAATAAYDLHRQGPILFFRSPVAGPSPVEVQPRGSGVVSEVVESMPAVDSQAAAKRVRLFGVNLFCSESEGDGGTTSEGASLSLLHSQPTLQSRYESSPSMSKEQDSSLDLDL